MTVLLSERSVGTGIRVVAKRHGEASRRTSRAPVVDVIANHLRSEFKPRLIEQVGLQPGHRGAGYRLRNCHTDLPAQAMPASVASGGPTARAGLSRSGCSGCFWTSCDLPHAEGRPDLTRDTVGNLRRKGFRLQREENVYLDIVKAIEATK